MFNNCNSDLETFENSHFESLRGATRCSSLLSFKYFVGWLRGVYPEQMRRARNDKTDVFQRSALCVTVTFFLIVLFCNTALCSEKTHKKNAASEKFFTEAAFITGFGSGDIPEGHYQPVLLIGHFGVDLKRYFTALENHRGSLSAFIEPQFNTIVNPDTDFECGIGFGIKYMYPFTDRISIYVMGSIGPHYISVITREQANGFLFSDTIGMGLYYYLARNSALNVGYRIRHLSNAALAEPNGGIDTHFGVIGYSVFFD